MGTNRPSAEALEKQADQQRQAVERTYHEVRRDMRHQLDLGHHIRRRPAAAYGIAGFFSLMIGYKLGKALKA